MIITMIVEKRVWKEERTGKSGRKLVRCGTSSRTKSSIWVGSETRVCKSGRLFWRENGGGGIRIKCRRWEKWDRSSCREFGWRDSWWREKEEERESGGGGLLEIEEKEAHRTIVSFFSLLWEMKTGQQNRLVQITPFSAFIHLYNWGSYT